MHYANCDDSASYERHLETLGHVENIKSVVLNLSLVSVGAFFGGAVSVLNNNIGENLFTNSGAFYGGAIAGTFITGLFIATTD